MTPTPSRVGPLETSGRLPVLVLDAGYGGLGAARSLGRMGIQVYATVAARSTPVLASRYWAGAYVWDFAHTSPHRSVEFLLEIGRAIGRQTILLPTSDASAVLVADHVGRLEEVFVCSRPPEGVVRSLIDKRTLERMAREKGVPTARSTFPASIDDVEEFLEAVGLPVIAKGIDPRLPGGTHKVVCRTAEEARSVYRGLTEAERANLMFQEFIPGSDEMVWLFNGYFDRHARCLAAFTGRKIRQYPPEAGVASLAVCHRNDPLAAVTVQFLEGIGYQGLVDVDYRHDMRDGRYKLLDVNPRLGATFRLFVDSSGLDVARIYYLDMIGQPVHPQEGQDGRKWVLEEDVLVCPRYWRTGRLGFRSWVSSVRGVRETAWFAADDPGPLLARLWWGATRTGRSQTPAQGQTLPATLSESKIR
jgi:predicted ATP-grasp superfamily ATP-dependent carboligase